MVSRKMIVYLFSIEAFQNWIDNPEDFTIQKIKAKLTTKDERIEYYCNERKKQIKEFKEYKKRNKALSQKLLVKKTMDKIEGKRAPHKVAIKKYFKNTFGDLLNDAMYELMRKQEKFPQEKDFFTVEGCCTFVGEYLLLNLPIHERESLKAEKEQHDEKKDLDDIQD